MCLSHVSNMQCVTVSTIRSVALPFDPIRRIQRCTKRGYYFFFALPFSWALTGAVIKLVARNDRYEIERWRAEK